MAAHLIEEKTEDAVFQALLDCSGDTLGADNKLTGGNLAGLYAFKGMGNQDINTPFLSVVCESAENAHPEQETMTGNWICAVNVDVVTHVNDSTRATHSNYVALIRDILISSNITALLNAAGIADFTAQRVMLEGASRSSDDDLNRTNTVINVWAYPSA